MGKRQYSTRFNASTAQQKSGGFGAKFLLAALIGGSFYFLGKPTAKYPIEPEKNSLFQYFKRSQEKLSDFFYGFQEPAFEKFLPDKSPSDPHYRPLTLVIDLDQFLVCHFWDAQQGKWRVAKRPNADMFLFYMAQYYELVLFSSMNQQEGEMILQKIDPYGCISYRLYRFATTFKKGNYYKDIGRLNRDLSKIVVLGHDEIGFSEHQSNFLQVPSWNGNVEDSLDKLIDFFEALAASKIDDVRPIIEKYRGKEISSTYDSIQRRLYNEMRSHHLDQINRRQKNFLFSLFANNYNESKEAIMKQIPSFEEKKQMLNDLRQKEYENAKKLMDEQIEKEKKKQEEYLKNNKVTMWDVAVNGPPQIPPSKDAAI